MSTQRDFQDIRILIPGYSIEDLPTDLNESNASSLLNAFATAWHPWLLNVATELPQAVQAESTELPIGQHIVFVPTCSEDWLAHDWKEQISDTLSVTFNDCSDRADWQHAIHTAFGNDRPAIPDELLQDFYALGTNYLMVTWLSRRMHHYVDPDANLLQSEVFAAAEAAITGDSDKAREHLKRCFECLLDCREQFQPTDCFLLDVCLPSDQTTATELQGLISESPAINLICSGEELGAYCQDDETFASTTSAALREGRLALLTGQQQELRTSLNSLSTVYGDIDAARRVVQELADDAPRHWARRRFGMTSSLPGLLNLFEFTSALHIVLDDGLYPDREYGQMEWRGSDGDAISAVSRIPMAIDGAASFLRFVDRFAESMQEDSIAVLLLARLPVLQTPWLNDLKIAASYYPVLGRFATMSSFMEETADQGASLNFSEGEYLSPYLIQSSVLKTEAPVSSPAALHGARGRLEALAFAEAISAVLKPKAFVSQHPTDIETAFATEEARRLSFDSAPPDTSEAQAARLQGIADRTVAAETSLVPTIAACIPSKSSHAKGVFLVNSLPWNRRIPLPWKADRKLPAATDCVTEAWQQDDQTHLVVNLPAGGFVWIHEAVADTTSIVANRDKGKPLAELGLLRNQFFEVQIHEETGGIRGVTFHGTRANRVSQLVAFRYEQSKTFVVDDEETTTSYAVTRLINQKVTAAGPFIGRIETTSQICDVESDEVLAKFRQTVTVERDSPTLHMRIEFDDVPTAVTGNPWMTYFAARFAWDNESSAIVRSCLGQAAGFRMERFEAPDYIEVADEDQRLLILPHGRPYHRRSGHRMLDSLLIVEGETERAFEFTLDFDQAYPMRSAAEVWQPVLKIETTDAIPAGAASGWIVGLSAKNVVAARTRVEPADSAESTIPRADDNQQPNLSVILLLQETEGRSASCRIRTARKPTSARLRKATGTTIQELTVTDDGVAVEFSRFQVKEVELTF